MEFRISDSFTSSLAKLTNDEQKIVKTTVFDLQINPENPGHQFHKLNRAQDKKFWSVRVSRDIRIIVHRSKSSLLLCFVNHHHHAYQWAEKRKLETHPTTGAAQLVEIRQCIKEVVVHEHINSTELPADKALLFDQMEDDELLAYGVPPEWLADVKKANEDSILELADHLPMEAAEALIEIAVGGRPSLPAPVPVDTNPFDHPDTQRRFRIINDAEELEQYLNLPWEKWAIFLHPKQKELVEKKFNGPARVSGSAGTGKTIVALHRAVYLANENPDARILLTTLSESLAHALQEKLMKLVSHKPRLAERIEVYSIDAIAKRLYRLSVQNQQLLETSDLHQLVLRHASRVDDPKMSKFFVLTEWLQVVDAWQIDTWETYRQTKRLGRRSRLTKQQRQALWNVFESIHQDLASQQLISMAGMYSALTTILCESKKWPFDFVIADEYQDISAAQLKFLSALADQQKDALFFTGDLGQRIFQPKFSWKSLGLDISGRSKTLHVNYRMSHQIRMQADHLLESMVSDIDDNVNYRHRTISLFNGEAPSIHAFDSPELEINHVATWLENLLKDDFKADEIAIIVRSEKEIDRAESALKQAGVKYGLLNNHSQLACKDITLSTMPLVKGLEFRAVVIMACDDDVIPSQSRIEAIADTVDLEEIYETERQLLYVACTRARDRLLVTSGRFPSEFLEDLMAKHNNRHSPNMP